VGKGQEPYPPGTILSRQPHSEPRIICRIFSAVCLTHRNAHCFSARLTVSPGATIHYRTRAVAATERRKVAAFRVVG
jgi:hypothetical protein